MLPFTNTGMTRSVEYGMKRTKKRKPADAIIVSDLHITESTPISRTDDYIHAQENKLKFLRTLKMKNNDCSILCSGDVFDYWKASPWLCSWAYRHLPYMITIPGQHDLPMHSLTHFEKSALSLLENVGRVNVLKRNTPPFITKTVLTVVGVPFGGLDSFEPPSLPPGGRILLLHEMVWKKKPGWAVNAWTSAELLEKYGNYFDLIVTGDNHQSFTDRKKECLLVNPGSMLRIGADQADFEPRCFLYYADENEAVPVPFPIEENVHSRKHLDKKKERDERIAAFIERIKDDWDTGLSFRDNLKAFFAENKIPRKVREIIWLHLEEEM
jgi:DNA repair exonuclease SbcCD nuclease subunit